MPRKPKLTMSPINRAIASKERAIKNLRNRARSVKLDADVEIMRLLDKATEHEAILSALCVVRQQRSKSK
jgi:hypothetical protein